MRTRLAVFLLLFAGSGGAAHAQADVFVEVKPGSDAVGVLPFGQRVILHGLLDPSAGGRETLVALWYAESREPSVFPLDPLRDSPRPGCTEGESSTEPCMWRLPSERDSTLTGGRFMVATPVLRPNRFYHFAVITRRPPTRSETEQFLAEGPSRLDKALRTAAESTLVFETGRITPLWALDSVRASLVRVLPRSAGLTYDLSNTVFDPARPWDSSLKAQYDAILSPYVEARARANTLDNDWVILVSGAKDLIGRMATNSGLQVLRSMLAQAKSLSPSEGILLDRLSTLPEKSHLSLARGQQSVTVEGLSSLLPVNLESCGATAPSDGWRNTLCLSHVWYSETLEPYRRNLQHTKATLTSVRALVLRAKLLPEHASDHRLFELERDLLHAESSLDAIDQRFGSLGGRAELEEQTRAALRGVRQSYADARMIVSTTRAAYDTRAKTHISPDVGVLYSTGIGRVRPYVGANFYAVPVNRDIPLGHLFQNPLQRTSLTLGVTVASVAQAGRRENLFASSAGIVGVGYRLTDFLRLSVGSLFFLSNDPNPLVTDYSLGLDPYVSLSVDFGIRDTLGGIGKALGL
jgi:hypothetical protein